MPRKKPERNKNPTAPLGDPVLELDARADPESQPISEKEKALVKRAYSLFDHFYDKLREEHEEMYDSRLMRQLKQNERSRTSPPSNTLNSCIFKNVKNTPTDIHDIVVIRRPFSCGIFYTLKAGI